jgi:hypothetical protein
MFWRNFSLFLTVLSLGGIGISIQTEAYDMVGLFLVMAILQIGIASNFHKKGK